MRLSAKQRMSRRTFLGALGAAAAGCAMGRLARAAQPGSSSRIFPLPALREARFYSPLPDRGVQCELCPRGCAVAEGQRGYCRARENRDGKYYSLVYGLVSACHIDPIEKKPFYHVYPGSKVFSIGSAGCNIHCRFCQNFDISQASPEDVGTPYQGPDAIVDQIARQGLKLLAFTYNEPTTFYEFMHDCAKAAQERGIESVIVSNGFINDAPQKTLFPLVKAIKIDLKAYSESFYARICEGSLGPVLKTLKRLAGSGVWYEIVNLVVPTLNDNMADLQRLSAWVVKELGPDVPIHFTRFTPLYRLRNLPPTPAETLLKARELALTEGCRHVYCGNIPGMAGEDTLCPACHRGVIRRYAYHILQNDIVGGKCRHCKAVIPGIWG